MAKKPTLGRGFDTLIPKDFDASILEEDKSRVQKILIRDIVSSPDQPRREFDEPALLELSNSIKQHGVLQPIIVVRDGQGYRIVAGERRWRAAHSAKLTHIPAIVRSLKELEQIELSLIENIQRVDLSPLEQALSVYRLQHQFSLALDAIAQKLGKAPSTLSNLTRLLKLPEKARQALKNREISEGHARAILSLQGNSAAQDELLRSILNNEWTVRQAEQFAMAAKKDADLKRARGRTASETKLTISLGQKLGTTVKIKHTARGGHLIVNFGSEDQLRSIVQRIEELDS